MHQAKDFDDVPNRIRPALFTLIEAIDYADQTNSDHWEFAVEIELLQGLGLRFNDFRWLVRNKLVSHRREVTLESDNGREFRTSGDLVFPDRTCFVLTAPGILFVSEYCRKSRLTTDSRSSDCESNIRNGAAIEINESLFVNQQRDESVRPVWDSERRLLSFDGMTVKHFKWSAQNQEAILSVFEEESWPPRIDDPLAPRPDQDSKRRLSDTIKCLNRKQSCPVVHFRGDGTGEGIVWELVVDNGNVRKGLLASKVGKRK